MRAANARYAPQSLNFIGLAMVAFGRRMGPKRFLQTVMASSKADLAMLENDEVLAAPVRGSEIALRPGAPAAWAAFALANYGVDWSEKLANCPAPMVLFAGSEDPFAPIETTREFAAEVSGIVLHEFADYGQLLYSLWPCFLGEIGRFATSADET